MVLVTLGTLAGMTGVAVAVTQFFQHEIKRLGGEQRALVQISAPFGSLILGSTSTPGTIAYIEGHGEDGEEPPMRTRYVIRGTTGILNISLGEDEGMVQPDVPLASTFRTCSPLSTVSATARHTDDGHTYFVTSEARNQAAYNQATRSHASAYVPSSPNPSDYGSRVFLTKELPLALDVEMGFGESMLDLSGLWLQNLNLETGANQANVYIRTMNPGNMDKCAVSAGVGEFNMEGIGNLNTSRFDFNGGFGVYSLNFSGKLKKDLQANVSIGVGKCSIRIPPEAGRLQVFYEDGVLSSYNFGGLAVKREGYATSVGFENSRAPVITLRLTSGAGRINVMYR